MKTTKLFLANIRRSKWLERYGYLLAEESILLGCKIFHQMIYRFNEITIKIQGVFFVEIDKLISKFILKFKRPRTGKAILQKKKVEGLILPDFKIYYKITIINTVCYGCKQVGQFYK